MNRLDLPKRRKHVRMKPALNRKIQGAKMPSTNRTAASLFLLFSLALPLTGWAADAPKPVWNDLSTRKVAILELVSRVSNEAIDVSTVSEVLLSCFVDQHAFQVVERSLIEQVVKEQKLKLSGLTEESAAKLGQLAGADKIITGTLSKTGALFVIVLKGIDAGSGVVDISDTVLMRSENDILGVLPVLCDRFLSKIKGLRVEPFQLAPDSATTQANSTTQSASAPSAVAQNFEKPEGVGYELFWDGKRAGHEAAWSFEEGVGNYLWNKREYPSKRVQSYYRGREITADGTGYELYRDYQRAGQEKNWSFEQGADNLLRNRKQYPGKAVHGFYNGQPVVIDGKGYELYFDFQRVGAEASWSLDQARENLRQNRIRYPYKKVAGFFDGKRME